MEDATFQPNQGPSDLIGCVALVTGTRGIGLEVASALHRRGAVTYVVGRDRLAGDAAVRRLIPERPEIPCGFEQADLGEIASLRSLSKRFRAAHGKLDILVNNAGIVTATRNVTRQGWERNIGVNYLGHFMLTGLLLPALRAAPSARVVSVVSRGAAKGTLRLNDFNYEQKFNSMAAYSSSKLALLSFGSHLNEMSAANEWGISSYVAHPGICPTGIMDGAISSPRARQTIQRLYRLIGHSPAEAAQSVLQCATDAALQAGAIIGPSGLMEMRGRPASSSLEKSIPSTFEAQKLWDLSQSITGSPFPA